MSAVFSKYVRAPRGLSVCGFLFAVLLALPGWAGEGVSGRFTLDTVPLISGVAEAVSGAFGVSNTQGVVVFTGTSDRFMLDTRRVLGGGYEDGGEGGEGMGYFAFSPVPSPQTAGTPFPLTVSVANKDGSPFSGTILLSASGGTRPDLSELTVSDGTWTGMVSLDLPVSGTQLVGYTGILEGFSNGFEVRSSTPSDPFSGSIGGVVRHGFSEPDEIVTVTLAAPGRAVASRQTGAGGTFVFNNLPAGAYTLSAASHSYATLSPVQAVAPAGSASYYEVQVHGTGQPVLLVPGILGSTMKNSGSHYPIIQGGLRQVPRDRLKPYFDRLLWKGLVDAVIQAGMEPYFVPWDWRLSTQDAVGLYLRPVITEAKRRSGQSKVHIVAHSLGGLLTREYVQGSSYANDIDRLALVGSPAGGSALAYYLWDGGDPQTADSMQPFSLPGLIVRKMYENTSKNIYRGLTGRPPSSLTMRQWRDFIHTNAPSLGQLRPVFPVLRPQGAPSPTPMAGASGFYCSLLAADPDRLRMQPPESAGPNAVKTRLFLSTGEPTVSVVHVSIPFAGVYPEGWPLMERGQYVYDTAPGDGTVRASSVLHGLDHLSAGAFLSSSGSHAMLPSVLAGQIAAFLSSSKEEPGPTVPEEVGPEFFVTVLGRTQPLLTDAQGRKAGVEDGVVTADEMPDTEVGVDEEMAGILARNPEDGVYHLSLTGIAGDVYSVDTGYRGGAVADEVSVAGIFNAEAVACDILLDRTGTPTVHVLPPVGAVRGLVCSDEAGVAALHWAAPETGAAGYRVYGRGAGARAFSFLGTATDTAFLTGHPWNPGDPGEVWEYAVQALDASGLEGFHEATVQNMEPVLRADFTASVREGDAPLTVSFTDASSGDPVAWNWDLDGDGEVDSTAQNPSWVYSVAGEYTVSLTVSDGTLENTEVRVSYVTVLGDRPVRVPELAGLLEADAGTALAGLGLVAGEVTRAHSDTVAEGRVVSQSPAASTFAVLGTAVSFVVSLGPAPVPVPSVVGMSPAEAGAVLDDAGFAVGAVVEVYHATLPAGIVVAQRPGAGTLLPPGSSVDLDVSKGPAPPDTVTVPDIAGLARSSAEAALTGAGLAVGGVSETFNATVAAGLVISQSPAAGSVVLQGSAVSFVVSRGPAPVAVPSVVGLARDAAETALVGAGLAVGDMSEAFSATVAAGLVISQNPVAGSSVPAGSAVSFVLSKGPQPVEGEGEGEGEPIGPTVEEARQALANAFTAADSNGDDRISFEEAVLVLPALTRALFDQLDTNKDGYLDRLELGLPEVTTGCSCRKGALSPSNIAQSLGDLFLGGLALLLLTALGRRRAG